jgi:hypothetical protein
MRGESRAAPMATGSGAPIPGHGAIEMSWEGGQAVEEQVRGCLIGGGIEWE